MSQRAPCGVALAASVALAGAAGADDSTGSLRRDPFRRTVPHVVPMERTEDGPLQRLTLAQLSLAAVLWGEGVEPRAMLQDSEGTGFLITTGARVGVEGGIVSAIEPGRVIVEQPDPASEDGRQVVLEVFPRGLASPQEQER